MKVSIIAAVLALQVVGCSTVARDESPTPAVFREQGYVPSDDVLHSNGFVIDEATEIIAFDDNLVYASRCDTDQTKCLKSGLVTLVVFSDPTMHQYSMGDLDFTRTIVNGVSGEIEEYLVAQHGKTYAEYSYSKAKGVYEICPHIERFPTCLLAEGVGVLR